MSIDLKFAASDLYLYLDDGSNEFSWGLDTTDTAYKLTTGNSPSSGDELLKISSTGQLTLLDSLVVGSSLALTDTAGSLALTNVDSIDTTTQNTIENALVDLPNLATIQTQSVTFSGSLTVEANSIVNQDLSSDASPTFNGATFSGLTASQLVATDGSKALTSVAGLDDFILGTANQIIVTDNMDGTVTLSTPQDIDTSATVEFGTLTLNTAGTIIDATASSTAGTVLGQIVNSDNGSSTSHARWLIGVGGGAAGDPMLEWSLASTQSYVAGIDNTDSDNWKLSVGSALGTNDSIIVNTSQNVGIGVEAVNKFDVNGAIAIGSSYAGVQTSPTDGLLVEGSVGIKTASPYGYFDVNKRAFVSSLSQTDNNVAIGTWTGSNINPRQPLTIRIDPTDTNEPTAISGDASSGNDPHSALLLQGFGNATGEKVGVQFGFWSDDTGTGGRTYGTCGIYTDGDSTASNTTGDMTFDFRESATDTAMTEHMRLTHEGNLGIGTSSPDSELEVSGKINTPWGGTASTDIGYYVKDSGGTLRRAMTAKQLGGSGQWLGFNSLTDGIFFANQADNTLLMTILDGGNVGIGTDSSPPSRLAVDNAGDECISIINSALTSPARAAFSMSGSEGLVITSGSVNSTDNDITFRTGSLAGSTNVRMTILQEGYVGIGTATPGIPLDVRLSTSGGGAKIAAFGGSAAERLQFFDELDASQGPMIQSSAGWPFVLRSSGGNITLDPFGGTVAVIGNITVGVDDTTAGSFTAYGGSGTAGGRVRIHSGGDVGVTNDYWDWHSDGNFLYLQIPGNSSLATFDTSGALSVDGALSGSNLSGTNTGDQTTSGTSNRITVTNGSTDPTIDISTSYVGQTSITTLGTIGTGTWQGTAIANAFVAQDLTINGGNIDNTPIGQFIISTGAFSNVTIGVNDTTAGSMQIYGGNGSTGGTLRIFGGATAPTNNHFDWNVEGDDLLLLDDASATITTVSDTGSWTINGLDLSDNNITNVGDISLDSLSADGSVINITDPLGLNTATVPHGGVGVGKLAIEGTNSSSAGPHVQFTTSSDDFPLMSIVPVQHDEVSIGFDAYIDSLLSWKSGDAGSNYRIHKESDLFSIDYDSGIGTSSTITWNTGIQLNTSGEVYMPGFVGAGTSSPTAALHVSGTSGTNIHLDGATTYGFIMSSHTATVDFMQFRSVLRGTQTVNTDNILVLYRDGGVTLGLPTGGDKGLGSLNVTGDLYKNNSAYTNPDYAFEHYYTGKIEKFISNEGAEKYQGLLSLEDVEKHVQESYRLPGLTDEPMGSFERNDFVLEKIEEIYLYLFEIKKQLNHLKERKK